MGVCDIRCEKNGGYGRIKINGHDVSSKCTGIRVIDNPGERVKVIITYEPDYLSFDQYIKED